MATLESNIKQAISDFDSIEDAIEDMGIDVPDGTDTSAYGSLIRRIGRMIVDLSYNPESENAQSGKAVCEALNSLPIKYVESTDDNQLNLFELESGTYILYGKFMPYPNAPNKFTFSKLQLVSVSNGTKSTCVQVFYPPYNAIQYLNIYRDETSETGFTYERKDAKLYYMESTQYKVNEITEYLSDSNYPTANAVKKYVDNAIEELKKQI